MTTVAERRPGTPAPGLRDTLSRLSAAQKGAAGAPLYSRFVNRPLGRLFAALAFSAGLTPNAVTALSATATATGVALLALVSPSVPMGLAVAACLVLGYGLDAADGQLARLRGGGSPAGEWLDHMVDAAKASSLHLAVLIGLYRFTDLDAVWLLVPLGYCVVDAVTYFATMLNEALRAQHGAPTRAARTSQPAGIGRSIMTLPTDYGLLACTFVLFGWTSVFVPVYTVLFLAAAGFLVLAAGKWFREMGRLPPMSRPPLLIVHPGAELYGADRMLLESAVALSGSCPVTVALPGPGPLVDELEARGIRVEICPMPVLRNSALRPRGALRLLADGLRGLVPAWRLLRRHPGGVYVSTLTLPSWPLLARLARRRSICHVHEAEQSAPRLLRRGMALCPALSDRVVANSRFTLDVLTEVAPRLRRRATVVHNAVRGPAEVVAARPRLDRPVRLLFVGRLNPRKGPQVAVAALRELHDRGVDAQLTVVGDVFAGYEWFAEELRAAVADAGLGDRVEFLGFSADVWPHLAGADVVLVPAIGDESFGNTAVEAVLAARPLVVSDHSGLREAAAGYSAVSAVPAGDPVAVADAVARVVTDWPRTRAAALADAAVARRRSSPERYAAELVDAVLGTGPDVVPVPRGLPVVAESAPVAGAGAAA